MRSQGRVGGGLEGCNPSSLPCVIVILWLRFLFSFLVLEKVVGGFVVHELQDCKWMRTMFLSWSLIAVSPLV